MEVRAKKSKGDGGGLRLNRHQCISTERTTNCCSYRLTSVAASGRRNIPDALNSASYNNPPSLALSRARPLLWVGVTSLPRFGLLKFEARVQYANPLPVMVSQWMDVLLVITLCSL